MNTLPIKIHPNLPKEVQDNSKIVSMGGEAPSFGPMRKPK